MQQNRELEMSSTLRTVLFINAHSRKGRRMASHVIRDFEAKNSGFNVVETIVVKRLSKMNSHLSRLKEIENIDCIIVGSGDGTIVSVINALKDRQDITYGFLPLGTSNTFVRSLGIPLTYQKAKKIVLAKNKQPVALGAINGKLFPNVAGLGVPVRVTLRLSNRVKKIFGLLSYLLSGLRAMVNYRAFYFHITNDEIHDSFYTRHILIANGKYIGNVPISREASVYKNQLVLVAFGISKSRIGYFRTIIRALFRRHEKDPNVRIIPFTRAHIATDPKRGIEADGEIIGQTPAVVEVIKDAITVFTPLRTKPRASKRRKTRR